MLRKADYRGSIRELTMVQLRDLYTKAQYRGLTAVAAAIARERQRRYDLIVSRPPPQRAFRQEYEAEFVEEVPSVDYAPAPRYDFDGYAGCRT